MSELERAALGIVIGFLMLAAFDLGRVALYRLRQANKEWSAAPVSYAPLWFVAALVAIPALLGFLL